MKQSPWEANGHSVTQEITRLSQNTKIPRTQKSPLIGPYPELDASNPHSPTQFL